jgi:tagatose-1,6-bisphosphate aldolase
MPEHAAASTPPPGLGAIAGNDGTFAIVAMDQRNTLRRMFAAAGRPANDDDLRAFKVDVADALSGGATGFLLDPDFGVPAVLDGGALHGDCGLLVAAELPQRQQWNGEPRTARDPARDAAWVAGLGGHALKFLVQLRPDRPRPAGAPDLVAEVLEVVRAVVEDCRAVGLPSVIECLVYRLPGEGPLGDQHRADLILESARLLDQVGPDLLKLEFPGDGRGCERIAQVLSVPWAVLSAGVTFERFSDALRVACEHGGASGFIAGRAIWQEAVGMDRPARRTFLRETGRRRLDACVEAIQGRARPYWHADG